MIPSLQSFRNSVRTIALIVAISVAKNASAQSVNGALAYHENHFGSDKLSSSLEEMLHHFEEKIYFVENKGQFSKKAVFKADFSKGQAIATEEGMIVGTFDEEDLHESYEQGMREEDAKRNSIEYNEQPVQVKGHGWLLNFVDHSPKMRIDSRTAHSDVINYFIGDSSQHALGVKSYQEVWYRDVYENVDVRFYPSAEGSLEYDIVCKPGFDSKSIKLNFDGIENVFKNDDGSLILNTSVGEMRLPAPFTYQKIDGKEVEIHSEYELVDANTIRFKLGKFDTSKLLIIDPIALRWATWLHTNSSSDNHGHGVWVDKNDGAIYVANRVTGSTNLITVGAFNTSSNGNLDILIGKYYEPSNIGGAGTRVWQTYVGGSSVDNPYALEQGPDGNIHIVGYTSSSNFPLLGGTAFSGSSVDQRSQSSDNIFLLKMNPAGNSIKSAVIGGNGTEGAYDLRIDDAGNTYVCGNTQSTNLATLYSGSGANNSNNGSNDALVFKINQNFSSIIWMKNYGGSSIEIATIMKLNGSNGDLFVAGYTTSSNFPTLNPRQGTKAGDEVGFLQKLKSNGSTVWSSFFNSDSNDDSRILCMEFNVQKTRLYFGGITDGLHSSNISSSGVYDSSHNGGDDMFVTCMDTSQTLIKSTYIGGTSTEYNMMGLNVDQNDDVYVFGYTNSTNFPTTSDALQSSNSGGYDKVFFKLSSNLSSLLFGTYHGGSGDEYDPVGERGIKFSNCRAYTVVTSKSSNLPLTSGALNTTKTSSSSIYEPGLVIWGNPPSMVGNNIYGDQSICAGTAPSGMTGDVPTYSLPTIIRNGSTSNYPSLGAISYQWQSSTDSVTWTNIVGGTGQNLPGNLIGTLNQSTFIRRIINGDACVIYGISGQIVTVQVLNVSSVVTDVSCRGLNNGAINLTAFGGTAPYSYSWSNGSSNEDLSSLSPGTYSVTVTDGNNCSVTSPSYTITEPAQVLSLTCAAGAGACSSGGAPLTTTVSGGTAPYSYLWNTGAITSSITALSSGTYSVTVTDAKGCTESCQISIGAPSISCFQTDVSCPNGTDGSATVTVNSGQAPYSYSWTGGGTSSTITGLSANSYTVTVSDANNCSTTCTAIVADTPDDENPTITCPATANITTDAGLCTSSASIGTATATDNCGVQSTTVSNAGPYS
ncbi:MAG: SBBP repeat-containing protein, partial [Flavobacteriales bacterium]|nr:SBBP repeat-containing protein [Flavobacteriales bacterium]